MVATKKTEPKSTLDTNLSLVSLAMLVILFLLQKTPLAIVGLLAVIFACLVRPILHTTRAFSGSVWLQRLMVLSLLAATFALGYHIWPPVSSDVRVSKTEVYPFMSNHQAGVNLWIHNDGPKTIEFQAVYGVSNVRPMPATPELERIEEEKDWERFASGIRKQLQNAPILSIASNTDQQLPHLFGPAPPLLESEIKPLQDGSSSVQVMAAVVYSDDSGTHETDFCMFTIGGEVRPNCRKHNGPVKPPNTKFLCIF